MIAVGVGGGITRLSRQPTPGSPPDSPPSQAVLDLGREVYTANCAACHGARGEGEPDWKLQKADFTYPAPPHDSTGHTWHHSDPLLYAIIKGGSASYDTATYRSRMPAWGDRLTGEQIEAVIAYLKSLWGESERAFQAEVTRQARESQ